MKSFYTGAVLTGLGVSLFSGSALAQDATYRSSSLLPLPAVSSEYPVYQPSAYAPPAARLVAQDPRNAPVPIPDDGPPAPPGQGRPYRIQPQEDIGPRVITGEPQLRAADSYMQAMQCCEQPVWFGSISGLLMTRDEENTAWLSFDTNTEFNRLMTSRDADAGASGGFDIRVGRWLNGGTYGIEGIYWGVFSGVEESNRYGADTVGNLSSPIDFDSLVYDAGAGETSVWAWFDDAQRHRLRREYEFHNVELNMLRNPCCSYSPCTSMQLSWLGGFRYVKFGEEFEFASDDTNTVFGDAPADELLYQIDVQNHLIGMQLGGRADYRCTERLRFHSLTKMGVYGNHITHRSFIGAANGAATVDDVGGPNNDRVFDLDTAKNDVALIGELDLGATYQFSPSWSAIFGYRAVGLTGVALATSQIPRDFDDIDDVESIDSNGSLILHGGYAGLQLNY